MMNCTKIFHDTIKCDYLNKPVESSVEQKGTYDSGWYKGQLSCL